VYLAILPGWISTFYSKFEVVSLKCLQLLEWQIIVLYFQKCWNFHKKSSKGVGKNFMKKIRYHSALTAWTLIMLFSEILKFWKKKIFQRTFFCEGKYWNLQQSLICQKGVFCLKILIIQQTCVEVASVTMIIFFKYYIFGTWNLQNKIITRC